MTEADAYPLELLNAVRRIGADAALRPVLHWLFGKCRVDQPSGTGDPLLTAFREGERGVGIEFHALLDAADPRIFIRLCTESASDEIARRAAEEKAEAGG